MRTDTLLIELGTEELPPKALKSLATAFAHGMEDALKAAELSFGEVTYFAAPRRLALMVTRLDHAQADKTVEKRGPAVNVAFDETGTPTKAAEGWARSNGITVAEAQRLKTDKGEWLLHVAEQSGESIEALLQGLVEKALSRLPIPKVMRWGDGDAQFIRPVHTVCALFGNDVVDIELFGHKSSRKVLGHRFHGNGSLTLESAADYAQALTQEYVIADFEQRRTKIAEELSNKAAELGLAPDYSDSLLDEITSLVEWPVVMQASFDESFLDVPKEALIYTMKDDQKYVPLLDKNGQLASTFLFVSNIESADPSQVVKGNERVIRPRLSDAQFFFETDKKTTLESRIPSLRSVVFQKQLGTLADKSERIAAIASNIAGTLGTDKSAATRAGLLAKTDLMTNMVMEFPDVQGVMGMHYAKHDGENEAVANALFEQYLPRFAGDAVATHPVSVSVALADKLDTLVGIFGIGQLPKGDKDPFALRRAAIGVLRTIIDNSLALDLADLVDVAYDALSDKLTNDECKAQVLSFVMARLSAMYQDKGVSIDVLHAVMALQPTKPSDFDARVSAVSEFTQSDAVESLAAAHKRTANILNKNAEAIQNATVTTALFVEDAEKNLAFAIDDIQSTLTDALSASDYGKVLSLVATLKNPVDAFFDNVMVMADEETLRVNRLALLVKLRGILECVADISKLVVKS
ncbi:glycine--tRNA ligase subunit beta [Alteromonas facilis]|uniref:glycine--tRNA ligase subunit beta n=1 Tax=Alteromonas facilis TaxID=2048004 RepID=UPI000C28501C|nr:glycine--tRNA ligase subunit beta [Alteromonas facilis]